MFIVRGLQGFRCDRFFIIPLLSIGRGYAGALSDPENKGGRQDHVNFDTLGTWDNRIELPVLMRESIIRGKPIPHIAVDNVGVATHVGRRTCNEDRAHVCEVAPGYLYAAVFDGHGGTECADYVCRSLPQYLSRSLRRHRDRRSTDVSSTGEDVRERDTLELGVILQNAFLEINNAFARHVVFNVSNAEGAMSGTTATVCLLKNSVELIVSHVGDSRALLCRNGESMALSTDHGPTVKAEKERIEKSGGNVVCNSVGQNLVNGRLAMTRSLGDLELKRYGVIALPDTRSLQVKHGNDAFLILTTDGVNSVMSNQEICDTVKRGQNPMEAAGFVVDQALQYASDDNTTAILVPFGSWGKFSSSAAANYSFGRNVIHSLRYM